MPELIEKLSFYLDFPFVRYAIIVGVLVSLCSSLLGVTLVLKYVRERTPASRVMQPSRWFQSVRLPSVIC